MMGGAGSPAPNFTAALGGGEGRWVVGCRRGLSGCPDLPCALLESIATMDAKFGGQCTLTSLAREPRASLARRHGSTSRTTQWN